MYDLHDHSPRMIVGGRRSGKTTESLKWLKEAKRVDAYPFWDRVLLTFSTDEAQRLRIQLRREAERTGVPDSGLYYNLVYSFEEWRRAHLGSSWEGAVAVDNAEFILQKYLNHGQHLAIVTMTAKLQVTKKRWWWKLWALVRRDT
jgi:hypothetical protein